MSKSTASRAIVAALLLSTSTGAIAAQVTPDGAKRLAGTLNAYLGGTVTVAPHGDGYATTIDPGRILSSFRSSGMYVQANPLVLILTPRADGKWTIEYSGDYALLVSSKEFAMQYQVNGITASYVFDPSVKSFVSGHSEIEEMSSKGKDPTRGEEGQVTRTTRGEHFGLFAVSKSPGSVDSQFDNKAGVTSIHYGWGPTDFHASMDSSSARVTTTGAHNGALLDVWAWLAAHPSQSSVADGQTELRPLLAAALPVFEAAKLEASAKNVSVQLPFKKLSVTDVSGSLSLPGFVDGGAISESLSIEGIDVNVGGMKEWMHKLLPGSIAIDASASKFDLGRAASFLLATADLGAEPPIAPDEAAKIAGSALGGGAAVIQVTKARATGRNYQVSAEGTAKLSPNAPAQASFTVTFKGLDALLDAVSSAANGGGEQPEAHTALMGLTMAKGLAKTTSGGLSTWVIDYSGGKLSVNGQPMEPR